MKLTYILFALFIYITSCISKEKNQIKVAVETEVVTPKNQILNADQQITSAILAAPLAARDSAKVYGYDKDNKLILLRAGFNAFICIADNPKKEGFQVVAYHISLEPYMSRGRELDTAEKSRKEKEELRSSEAASGVLKMPENPATLHLYYGKNGFFNTETGAIENAKYRYVVYIPYATQKSTGLPLSPNGKSHPWLMFPGKYNSHIMMTPLE
jgi:hypothetical protein